jgi:hypothetical protein
MEVIGDQTFLVEVYLYSKEVNDRDLSLRLRKEGVIVTPGWPFEASQLKELEGLFHKKFYAHATNRKHKGLASSRPALSTRSRARWIQFPMRSRALW